jgi:hypothetical protein
MAGRDCETVPPSQIYYYGGATPRKRIFAENSALVKNFFLPHTELEEKNTVNTPLENAISIAAAYAAVSAAAGAADQAALNTALQQLSAAALAAQVPVPNSPAPAPATASTDTAPTIAPTT